MRELPTEYPTMAAMMIPSKVTGGLLAGMWPLLFSEHIGGYLDTCCGTKSPGSGNAVSWLTGRAQVVLMQR